MGRPDYILVNSEKPRDAAMRNTGTGFVCFRTTACLFINSVFFTRTASAYNFVGRMNSHM